MYWRNISVLNSIKMKFLIPPSHISIEVYQKLLPLFLDEIVADFKQLKSSYMENNWEEVKRLSHKINGVASSYGAFEIQKEAAYIENSSKKDVELNKKAVLSLECAIERLNNYIQTEFKQLYS